MRVEHGKNTVNNKSRSASVGGSCGNGFARELKAKNMLMYTLRSIPIKRVYRCNINEVIMVLILLRLVHVLRSRALAVLDIELYRCTKPNRF